MSATPGSTTARPADPSLIRLLDLAPTAVFAVEGGTVVATADFEVCGVAMSGYVTAVGDGMLRVLLTPPRVNERHG
jgi:uncharacterized membrane protein YeiH